MPELPEVETIARGLARRIHGQVVIGAVLHRSDVLHGNGGPVERLMGRRIEDVRRCGKQVRIFFQRESAGRSTSGKAPGQRASGAPAMYVHLGMTGRLIAVAQTEQLERHTHLVLDLAGQSSRSGLQLRFIDPRRFGGIWLINEAEDRKGCWRGRRLPPIGADPLEISLPALQALLARKRQIKSLLLDQQPISGMGNIYCDEALYRAGIHPLTPAVELDVEAVRRLRLAIRRVLTEAIRAGGSSISDYRTADNTRGSFQDRHRVYGREGENCRSCGSTIERLTVAGRGTHICPRCQPLRLGKTPARRL